MSEKLYGLCGQEILDDSMECIMERIIDDNFEKVGESESETLERIEFPINVYVYKRQQLPTVARMRDHIVENTIEWLDENYRMAADECSDVSDKINEAALKFAEVICAEYVPYDCEETGEVVALTRSDFQKGGES